MKKHLIFNLSLILLGTSCLNAASQTTDNRKTELPLEDHIAQRFDITTNCELRTTNCNNSGPDLSCYLMMNPEEISEAENAFGFTERKPLAPRKTHFSDVEASVSSGQQSSSSTAIVGKRKRGDEEDAAQVSDEGDGLLGQEENYDNIFYTPLAKSRLSSSAHSSADYQVKALEAEKAGKITLAAGYREAVAILKDAVDQFEISTWQTTKTALGANHWFYQGLSLQAMADYVAKANEAQELGKMTLAASYREATAISEQAVKQFKKADQIYLEQLIHGFDPAIRIYVSVENRGFHMYYGNSWKNVGKSLQAKADYQVKASEAEEAGKAIVAAGYREAAATSEQAVNQFEAVKPCYQAARKFDEASREDGYSFSGNRWWSFNLAGKSLQAKAKYQVKASEAEEAGKAILATGYREVAAILEQSANQFEEAAQAHDRGYAGQSQEGNYWDLAGKSLQSQADYHKKMIEAEEAGKVILAAAYREIIATSQFAVDQYEKTALYLYTTRGWWRSREASRVAKYLKLKEEDQVKAIGKIEKEESEKNTIQTTDDNRITPEILRTDGIINPEPFLTNLSSNFTEALKKGSNPLLPSSAAVAASPTIIRPVGRIIMDLSIRCEKWLVETRSAERPVNILSYYVIDVLKRGADFELVRSFEKYRGYVAKAHESEDDSQALAWIQVAEDIQQAIEYSIKAGVADRYTGQSFSAWNNVMQATQKLAECREKYIQKSLCSQTPEIVNGWEKIVEGSQSVVDYLRKAAEAYSLMNNQEYNHFNSAADFAKDSVRKLEKAIEFLEKSNAVNGGQG